MPGPNSDKEPLKEKLLTIGEFADMNEAGLVVPLHELKVRIGGREEAFLLLYISGHGIALHSRQTGGVYMLAPYGLLCLAKSAGIDRPDVILPGSEVSRG